MPANPIQRKTRNAFLGGMVIMLIVAVIVGAILFLTVFSEPVNGLQSRGKGGVTYAYRLTSEVKSGSDISADKVQKVEVYLNDIPADYINQSEDITAYKAKVDLQKGTVLCGSIVYKDEKIANSTRLVEYNMITLPSTLRPGDYIDVRFAIPNCQDFIVLSKKQVVDIKDTTISLYLTEDEILMMSSAIVESYIMTASNLYANQYVEAGMQEALTPTYAINSKVYQLIAEKKVNIEDYAKINSSYSTTIRSIIEQQLGEYAGQEITNIKEGMDTQKNTSKELYLSGLSGN